MAMTLRERIKRNIHVNETTGCWIWTGYVRPDGYGRIQIVGEDGKRRPVRAHRVSYEAFVGPIKGGLLCLHRCDVKSCVRPDHLELGTAQDNSDHARQRGGTTRGERSSRSKLSEDQVAFVRDRFLWPPGWTQRDVAHLFGVGESTVSEIRSGKSRNYERSMTRGKFRKDGTRVGSDQEAS